MSVEPAIKVSNLSKKFARSLKRAMIYGLQDIAKATLIPRRVRSPHFEARLSDAVREGDKTSMSSDHRAVAETAIDPAGSGVELRRDEFWALQDVSFEVQRGECVGLVGPNGAGKSTIFKVLSGILAPTNGRVELRGRLTALIEVGSGFHPMLSGRENIYISGAVLGMRTEEIDRKYEDIVEFSGVGEFIDMPVKFYSSGMHVRLGFSVLAHLDPEIMLIDEILAVGDMEFQKKCIDRINELRAGDMAIALVSHSLYRIESLCHRVIWLDHGKLIMEGPARDVVTAYTDHELLKTRSTNEGSPSVDGKPGALTQSQFFTIKSVEIVGSQGGDERGLAFREDFTIRIAFHAKERIERPCFNLAFQLNSFTLFHAAMDIDGLAPEYVDGDGTIECRILNPRLLPKTYQIMLFIHTQDAVVYLLSPTIIASFTVTSIGLDVVPSDGSCASTFLMRGGVIQHDYEWDTTASHE